MYNGCLCTKKCLTTMFFHMELENMEVKGAFWLNVALISQIKLRIIFNKE